MSRYKQASHAPPSEQMITAEPDVTSFDIDPVRWTGSSGKGGGGGGGKVLALFKKGCGGEVRRVR